MNDRSVMFPFLGRAHLVENERDKATALDALIDNLAPGRASTLRPVTAPELRQTAILWIELDEASAKVRTGGVNDHPGGESWPVWAGVVPVAVVSAAPDPLDSYSTGRAPAGLGGSSDRRRPPRSATRR